MAYYDKPTDLDDDEKIRLSQLKTLSASIDAGFNAAENAIISSINLKDKYESAAFRPPEHEDAVTHTFGIGFGKPASIITVTVKFLEDNSSLGYSTGDEVIVSQDTHQGVDNVVSTYSDNANIYVILPATGIYLVSRVDYTKTKMTYSSTSVEFYVRAWV
jgi:hypothetical protein